MEYSFLDKRTALSLSGDDLITFLQGLISNDARILEKNLPLYAALLSPQGKFLHDFHLIPYGGKVVLDIASEHADSLLSKLKIYRLRSKIEVEKSDLAIAALWNGNVADMESEIKIFRDPRLPELGFRAIGPRAALEKYVAENKMSRGDYEAHRLSLGVPDTHDMTERSLLLECGFEELHGVDFNKGCYVGQEVTARSKFRGAVRKSFYIGRAEKPFPAAGTELRAGEQLVGEVRTSAGNIALLRVNSEAAEAAIASMRPLYASDLEIRIERPIWKMKTEKNV